MKMEQTENSETSAYKIQTPGITQKKAQKSVFYMDYQYASQVCAAVMCSRHYIIQVVLIQVYGNM